LIPEKSLLEFRGKTINNIPFSDKSKKKKEHSHHARGIHEERTLGHQQTTRAS